MSPEKNQPLVLIADDEPTQLLLCSQTLKNEGYTVTTAVNGAEALELFRQHNPDIVLLDVLMPEMDGFEACQAIRRLPQSRHLPILMVTGLEDIASINQAYDSGATDFITKPLNWLILAQRVRYMLRASQAMLEVQKSKELLANAQQLARLGNWEWDLEHNKMQWSAEIFRLFGLSPQATSPSMGTLLELILPEDRQSFQQAIEQAKTAHKRTGLELRTPTGQKIRYLDSRIDVILDDQQQKEPRLLVGTFQDITERKEASEKIRFLASYDPLTGLPNRKLFTDYLTKAISRTKRTDKVMGIMVLNIDRFKRINDSLGSGVGDLLLREITKRLQKSVRREDDISRIITGEINLARRGGDEFSLLFADISKPSDLGRMAKRLQQDLKKSFFINNQEIFITASIGITMYPADGTAAESLLKNSDAALHHAKALGHDSYQFYSESINAQAMEQIELENNLRKALDLGQFRVFYQPQIGIEQKQITGAEALIRWQHPDLGLVPPFKFIPLAEDTGMIIEIGKWVLHTACIQQVQWQKAGFPIRMAVNISAVQFHNGNLVQTVREAIEKSGIDPHFLELELTESIIINESAELIDIMMQLKNLGIRLVVDDFGTGYSSLRYLKIFPLNGLKVDRSFVKDIPGDSNDCALSEAIMYMARSLKLEVVAEGVETPEQFHFFARQLCGEIQGFLFSPPVPAAEFETLLRSNIFTQTMG